MYFQISNPMDYHAALYIRLSKEDENEGPSESVNNQQSLLTEFVRQHRLSVFDNMDDGWSGGNFDRPNFQRMIADIEAKKVNMVITKDLSRLGRDYIMTGHYMERYFPEHRVLVEKVAVHAPDKSSGHRVQRIDVHYYKIGEIDLSPEYTKKTTA